MNPVVSAVPGRIRIRDKNFRGGERLDRLQEKISTLQGAISVAINERTGSLLLYYDSTIADSTAMESAVTAITLAELGASRVTSQSSTKRRLARQFNRYSKYGMLGSLAISMAYAAAGKKKLHAATGGLFGAFLGVHMLVHRRHLLK